MRMIVTLLIIGVIAATIGLSSPDMLLSGVGGSIGFLSFAFAGILLLVRGTGRRRR